MLKILRNFSVALAIGFASLSFAQEQPMRSQTTTTTTQQGTVTNVTTVRKERKAQLNFEDELVEGSTQKPELFYLFQKKNFNYKRLIKLRENFLPEMRRSTEDVQRVRGVN